MYYVSVDIEGMSGFGYTGAGADSEKEILRRHILAVAEGLRDAGETQVRVTSFHGFPDGLPGFIDCRRDRSIEHFDFPGFDQRFTGLILLGFHGVAPQSYGHSYRFENLWLNGRKCGEVTVQMLLAACRGIPTVLNAGNGGAVAEAKELLPDLASVITRPGVKDDATPINQSILHEIRLAAKAMVRNPPQLPTVPTSLVLEIPFRSEAAAQIAERLPYPVRRHGLIVSRESANFEDIYKFLIDSFRCVDSAKQDNS